MSPKKNSEPQTIEGNAPEATQALATSPAAPQALAPHRRKSSEPDPFLSIIERAIMTPNFEVSKLQQLLEVRERWEKNEAAKAYTVAITKFKQNPPTIIKNRAVGFDSKRTGDAVSYSHATLDQVCDAVIKGLSDVGISHKWRTEQPEGKVRVTCVLRHELGGTDEATLEGPPDMSGTKNAIQGIGSTVTYLERYTLLAVTGLAVAGTDTDGTARPSLEEIVCSACGNAGAIIKGKEEYGGGYVCWKGKNGCGATFETLPGSEAGEQPAGASRKMEDFKQNKFAGKVEGVRKVDAGDHQVLVLKLQWGVKKKGKNNKWTTVTEEGVVVAEQGNFMRVLEGSTGTKIEVMCSQQPSSAGKTYWRIEKLLKGGSEPPKPAGETKQPGPTQAVPSADSQKSQTKGAQPAGVAQTDKAFMMPCFDCAHPSGIHTYGTDGCTSPNCPCKKFTTGPTGSATAPATAKPAPTPATQSATQPASAVQGQRPVIQKVPRTLTLKGGKKQNVEWHQVRGKIAGFGWSKDKQGNYQLVTVPTVGETSKRTQYMAIVLEGLPQWKVPDNQKSLHDLFHCWHKSLFDALKTAKAGDSIVFCYEPEVAADGRLFEQVEDIEWIRDVEFMNGKPVMPGYDKILT